MDTLTLYASAGGSGGGSTKPAYECSTHSRSAINADVMQLEDILFSESRSCGLESHRRHQFNAPAAETDKAFEADDGWV